MNKHRISDISTVHYLKFFGRSAMFIICLVFYIIGFSADRLLSIQPAVRFFAVFVWAVFMIEMLMKYFPLRLESMGCQKQFAANFILVEGADTERAMKTLRQYDRGAFWIAVIWILVNGIFAVLYFSGIIDQGILLLLSLFYSVSDMICILFFCPFQTWFMKNKCCISCRIYTWDYMLMFMPLLFIRSFFTWSLCAVAAGLLARWEYIYRKHPERFSDETNGSLHCSRCREKLCAHKKQLRHFHKAAGFAETVMKHIHH